MSGRMDASSLACPLQEASERLAMAAAEELGLPIDFTHEQIAFATRSIADLPPGLDTRAAGEPLPVLAISLPANTEGAMAAYLIAKARSRGWAVRARLSRRASRIAGVLAEVFAADDNVDFACGDGESFILTALADPAVALLQVFGDASWMRGYQAHVERAGKVLAFEGSGKDPLLVLEGTDLDEAVRISLDSGLFAGGAACMSAERFLVHDSLADAFVERLVACLADVTPAPPDRPGTRLGFLYSEAAARRAASQVVEAISRGARMRLGGLPRQVEWRGRTFHAFGPVVLTDVPRDADVLASETFAPVFPIRTFSAIDEAIEEALGTPYGLSATVVGPTELARRAAKRLGDGHANVYCNASMAEAFKPEHWACGGFGLSGWTWGPGPDRQIIERHGRRSFRALLDDTACAFRATRGAGQ